MKIRKFFIALAVFALLTACAQTNPHPMEMTQLLQNAKTSDDHKALAVHYEDAAQKMLAKVAEHKQLQEQYQRKSYGKQAQNFKDHCLILINAYQKAADANLKMANDHRQMAAEVK